MSRTLTQQRGRADEIDAAVELFGPEMYGLALSIAAEVHDAQDAYQAAWLSATRHWDQLRTVSKRRAWLAAIVVRAARRTSRRRLVRLTRETTFDTSTGLEAVMPWDPAMAGALRNLSVRQRQVVALHYGHGYSLDEVAAILGCRGGTVRAHLSRALEKLREALIL
ncbi:MAG: RNA polymerase sigma factor [Candidatus Dormibacteria bacterium]